MSGLLRSPSSISHEQRVLGLLDDLAEDVNAIDLDTIDGEFYWRACRVDLLEQVEALCADRHDPQQLDISDIDKPGKPDAVLGFLRQGLRQANALYATEAKAATLYPRAVWRRLLEGERVAMRAAEADVRNAAGGEGRILYVKIFSGAWKGVDVEAEVRRLDPDQSQWLDDDGVHGSAEDAVRLAVEFSFSNETGTEPISTDALQRSRYITVGVPLPGPPPGVISREYEALVCTQRQWHLHLPGAGTRQDKEVALRTWAVGLLMAEGSRFVEAMRLVSERDLIGEVSQTRFSQDRQQLLLRVPEATSYLFSKIPTRSHPQAMDRSLAMNPAAEARSEHQASDL
jgi:hypothetical protein